MGVHVKTDLERHGCMVHSGYKTCALHCFHDRRFNADKNVNWLKFRESRATPDCDAGLHVLRRPGVL